MAEPEEQAPSYGDGRKKWLPGWVLRCVLCAREAGDVERVLPKVAAGRLRQ